MTEKIDLEGLLSDDARIGINDILLEQLFDTAYKTIGREILAKIFSVSRCMINSLKVGRRSIKLDDLEFLLFVNGLSLDNIFKDYIILKGKKKRKLKLARFLEVDQEFAEFYGLFKGEGTISGVYLSITNSEIDILKFSKEVFVRRLGIDESYLKFDIKVPLGTNKGMIKEKYSKILDTSKSQIYVNYGEKCKKPCVSIRFNFYSFASLFLNLDKTMLNSIIFSSIQTKTAFLRGLFAVEGSVDGRAIVIVMKSKLLIELCEKLLKELKITTNKIIETENGKYQRLAMSNFYSLKRFCELVGFSKEKERGEKLNRLLKTFIKFYPMHVQHEKLINSMQTL